MVSANITEETSLFKFSKITHNDFNTGSALFILANLDKLGRKDKSVIVNLVKEICIAYLHEHDRYLPFDFRINCND